MVPLGPVGWANVLWFARHSGPEWVGHEKPAAGCLTGFSTTMVDLRTTFGSHGRRYSFESSSCRQPLLT